MNIEIIKNQPKELEIGTYVVSIFGYQRAIEGARSYNSYHFFGEVAEVVHQERNAYHLKFVAREVDKRNHENGALGGYRWNRDELLVIKRPSSILIEYPKPIHHNIVCPICHRVLLDSEVSPLLADIYQAALNGSNVHKSCYRKVKGWD